MAYLKMTKLYEPDETSIRNGLTLSIIILLISLTGFPDSITTPLPQSGIVTVAEYLQVSQLEDSDFRSHLSSNSNEFYHTNYHT